MLQLTFREGFFIFFYLRVCCLMQVWRLTFQAYHKRMRARAFVWACVWGITVPRASRWVEHPFFAANERRTSVTSPEHQTSRIRRQRTMIQPPRGMAAAGIAQSWLTLVRGHFNLSGQTQLTERLQVKEMLPVSWWSSATWGGLWAGVASSDWPAGLSWLLWSPPSPCSAAFITKTEEEGHRLAQQGMVSEWGDWKYVKNDTNMTSDWMCFLTIPPSVILGIVLWSSNGQVSTWLNEKLFCDSLCWMHLWDADVKCCPHWSRNTSDVKLKMCIRV